LCVEGNDRSNRAEDLFARNRHRVVGVAKNRRACEIAFSDPRDAACEHFAAFFDARGDVEHSLTEAWRGAALRACRA